MFVLKCNYIMNKYRYLVGIAACYVAKVEKSRKAAVLVPERELAQRFTYNVALAVARRNGGALVQVMAALVVVLLSGCVTTRPLDAYVRSDGTRVGVSKQVVFFRPYDMAEAIDVARDHADIAVIDSAGNKMRVRAFGSAYITTVTGK